MRFQWPEVLWLALMLPLLVLLYAVAGARPLAVVTLPTRGLSRVTGQRNMPRAMQPGNPQRADPPVAPGSYESAAILLLTDGQYGRVA